MAADDDRRSVRIEVERQSAPILDVPETSAPTSGGSRVPIVVVGLLIALLGTTLVLLSPADDEAADGTERAAPTTTIPDEAQGSGEDSVDDASVEEAAVLPTTRAPTMLEEQIRPIRADVDTVLAQVLETNSGFVALDANQPELGPPQLLTSPDGVVWNEVETTISSPSGRDLRAIMWGQLFATGDGFALIGVTGDEVFRTEVARSTDAVNWTVSDREADSDTDSDSGAASDSDSDSAAASDSDADGDVPARQPIAVGDGGVISAQFNEQPIERVLSTFTNVELGGRGVCRVLRAPGDDQQFTLFSCTGPESALLSSRNVLSGNDPDEILQCVASLGNQIGGVSVSFVESSQDGESIRTFGRLGSGWSPTGFPTLLDSGSLVFIDSGFADTPACETVIDVPEQRGPAVVLLDSAQGAEDVFELPVELDNGNGPGSIFGVEILGETTTFRNGSFSVLVTIGEQLWALDPDTAEWKLLYDTTNEPELARFGELMLSSDGNRVYQPTPDGLRILELVRRRNGGLTATVNLAAVDAPPGLTTTGFVGSDAIFAADDLLILSDRANQRVWTIDLPPPEENSFGFSPDLGGVGVARVR